MYRSPVVSGGARPRSGQRPVVVLAGPQECRPDGIERTLIQAGFQLIEAMALDGLPDRPEIVLLTLGSLADHHSILADVLAATRSSSAQVMVVIDRGTFADLVAATEAGADDCLVWPFEPGELVARIWARVISPRRHGAGPADADLRLHDVVEQVVREVHRDDIMAALVRALAGNLEIGGVRFIHHDREATTGRLVAANRPQHASELELDLAAWPESVEAIRTGSPVLVRNVGADPRFRDAGGKLVETGLDSAAAIPVVLNGRSIGTLVLRSRQGEPGLTGGLLAFAELAVSITARLLEAEERRGKIARMQGAAGRVDVLTGCGTLDVLDQRLREEFERARRYSVPFSLVLLDVDGMAGVNERLGRDGGNRLLAWLGRVLHSELRSPDFVARYGGEEFVLLLPQTDECGARRAVARIRESLDNYRVSGDRYELECSLTAGVVTYPRADVMRPEELFPLLESAMLEGKRVRGEGTGPARQPVSTAVF